MKVRRALLIPALAGGAVAAVTLGVLALGSTGSAAQVREADLRGRVFLGSSMSVDGKTREFDRADGVSLGFNKSEAVLGAFHLCENFVRDYRLSDGRLVPVGHWSSTDRPFESGAGAPDCLDKATIAQSKMLTDFYFAGPRIELSGDELTLRDSRIELRLIERSARSGAYPATHMVRRFSRAA